MRLSEAKGAEDASALERKSDVPLFAIVPRLLRMPNRRSQLRITDARRALPSASRRGRTHVLSSSGRMPMPVSRRMSLPGSPPSPASALAAEMVTLSSPEPTTTAGSVRLVSRSFSSASLALERSSRRKMSLEP
jgi:hypothetical protein